VSPRRDAKHRPVRSAGYVILGGGNAKLLKQLPPGARLGDNNNAFRGGFRLWKDRLR